MGSLPFSLDLRCTPSAADNNFRGRSTTASLTLFHCGCISITTTHSYNRSVLLLDFDLMYMCMIIILWIDMFNCSSLSRSYSSTLDENFRLALICRRLKVSGRLMSRGVSSVCLRLRRSLREDGKSISEHQTPHIQVNDFFESLKNLISSLSWSFNGWTLSEIIRFLWICLCSSLSFLFVSHIWVYVRKRKSFHTFNHLHVAAEWECTYLACYSVDSLCLVTNRGCCLNG